LPLVRRNLAARGRRQPLFPSREQPIDPRESTMTDEKPDPESTEDVEAHEKSGPTEKKYEPAEDVEAHKKFGPTEKKYGPTEKKY
jgi:hypothetical protein